MRSNVPHRASGFTLVELLVVITMIVVLVAISVSVAFRMRKSGDKVVAANNIRQIQTANMGYAMENGGRFVPPVGMVDDISYEWFENPVFVSQIKGEESTYRSGGTPDTSLDSAIMDPAVVRARAAGFKSLGSSYGYTRDAEEEPLIQARLIDPARSAAFITANVPFAADKSKISYRHSDKAIVAFYDGHAQFMGAADISRKSSSDIFWKAVLQAENSP